MGMYGDGDEIESDDDDAGWMASCCDEVVDCIVKMVSGHSSDRPTVIEAIKFFIQLSVALIPIMIEMIWS